MLQKKGSMSLSNSNLCNNSTATLWRKNEFWAQHKLPGLLLMTCRSGCIVSIYLPAWKFQNRGFLDILQKYNVCPWPKAHQNRGHQSHVANIACNFRLKAPKIGIVQFHCLKKCTKITGKQRTVDDTGQKIKLDLFSSSRHTTSWMVPGKGNIPAAHLIGPCKHQEVKTCQVKQTTGTSSIYRPCDRRNMLHKKTSLCLYESWRQLEKWSQNTSQYIHHRKKQHSNCKPCFSSN